MLAGHSNLRRFGWFAVFALSFVWFGWVRSAGFGNIYYSGSAITLSSNPQWLLSGAFDSGGFVTVDKPPVGLWPTTLGAATGGSNGFALILPSAALAWAAAWFTSKTAPKHLWLLALILALAIPGLGVLARSTLPDATMLAFGTGAAMVLLGGKNEGRFAIAGALVGFALLAKPGAILMVPAFVVAVVAMGERRARRLFMLAGALVGVLGVWVLAAEFTPGRPYFGGTIDNSAIELIVGPDTASRVLDASLTEGDRWVGLASAGEPGPLRTVVGRMGRQAGYLLLLAVLGGVSLLRSAPKSDRCVALFWWVWLVVHAGVYSALPGIAHSYYAASLVPPVAVLVAMIIDRASDDWLTIFGAVLSLIVTFELLRNSSLISLPVLIGVLAVVGVAGASFGLRSDGYSPAVLGAVAAVAAVMLVVSVQQLTMERLWDFDPAAGDFDPAPVDPGRLLPTDESGLVDALATSSAEWVLATDDEVVASLLATSHPELSVMLVGGFLSRDQILEEGELERLIDDGEVGFVLEPKDSSSPAGRELSRVLELCDAVPRVERLRRCSR